MAKLTKNRKDSMSKFDKDLLYSLEDASKIIKDFPKLKFDSSVDIAVNLGVDPKKADQNIRGVVTLPNGTGKDVKVLALVTPEKEEEAKNAGADLVGLDEYIKKIKDGWTEVDVIITMPSIMGKLGPLGRILGPRGLMPNPKSGTVTKDVGQAVKNAKAGQVRYRADKNGIIHGGIGTTKFKEVELKQNLEAVLGDLVKSKPSTAKGIYIKKITVSSTMGPGLIVDQASLGL